MTFILLHAPVGRMGHGWHGATLQLLQLLQLLQVPSREAVSGSTFVRRRGHRGDLGRLCSHGAIHGERPGGRDGRNGRDGDGQPLRSHTPLTDGIPMGNSVHLSHLVAINKYVHDVQ